ncbi:alpha/beta hydrolase [Radiobacillus kanasensis]|uniref:alpha/beta hydrolase n=1 Tax=Radiobacillus kanasensis TaxID=2844358 RepID=UPI001E42A7F0|nr:alpha/beta hydrolase [Radiobacillus kanasensis]UFU01192.1 alpha/beta hydrolase [Radiobacillus kanasensis]
MIEQIIQIYSEKKLEGTLSFPDKTQEKYPALLILPGTGTLNRDGNDPKGKLELRLYKQLANFFSSLGFMTLRYDKRGVGKSEGEAVRTGLWDLVEDAEAALEYLHKQSSVDQDNTFVLGHSEGTTLATALYARKPYSGMLLMAGGGEKMEEAIHRQRKLALEDLAKSKGLKGKLIKWLNVVEKDEKKNKALMEKIKTSDTDYIRIQGFFKFPAKWMREHLSYDLTGDLGKVQCPVLAVTGDKDFQADASKLKRLPELVQGSVEYHIIKDMDHSLKEYKKLLDISSFKKDYIAGADKDIHPELQKIFKEWVADQLEGEVAHGQ